MKIRRVTAISIQTDEAILVRRDRNSAPVMCKQCSAAMVSPEDAAGQIQRSVRDIYRMLEAGQLHFHETSAGAVLVCLESLRKAIPRLVSNAGTEINSKEK
ncbi:MAG TPA: hypothetical protein VMH04_13700 [Candidatus Solibacter sp.]|nr:hypothetical protein [Candidatus Solibacter sp.]